MARVLIEAPRYEPGVFLFGRSATMEADVVRAWEPARYAGACIAFFPWPDSQEPGARL